MSAPSFTALITAVRDQINAGGLGVTASAVWRGVRDLEGLEDLTVEVFIGSGEYQIEDADTATAARLVGVSVRKRAETDADIAQVAEKSEEIGLFLLSADDPLENAAPLGMTLEPILDDDALRENNVAESITLIRYESYGS